MTLVNFSVFLFITLLGGNGKPGIRELDPEQQVKTAHTLVFEKTIPVTHVMGWRLR